MDSRFNWIRLRYLPSSQSITSLVQNFISWIRYSKTGEDSSSLLRRSTELTLRLIRNGQADAVEVKNCLCFFGEPFPANVIFS